MLRVFVRYKPIVACVLTPEPVDPTFLPHRLTDGIVVVFPALRLNVLLFASLMLLPVLGHSLPVPRPSG